ncbi:MAG: hypothetical protein R6V57_06970 [Vicinamibacterales bacterium]
MSRTSLTTIIQRAVAMAAALFGLATIAAGVRVLAGADPGYVVFRPLLLFNTAMGFAYVGAGVLAWRDLTHGTSAAAAIFGLNLVVLGAIGYLYSTGSAVAVDSLRAMTLRTGVWLAFFLALAWLRSRDAR